MKFFLDTANMAEIKECVSLGLIDGITVDTNQGAITGNAARDFIMEAGGTNQDINIAINAFAVSTNNLLLTAGRNISVTSTGSGVNNIENFGGGNRVSFLC